MARYRDVCHVVGENLMEPRHACNHVKDCCVGKDLKEHDCSAEVAMHG